MSDRLIPEDFAVQAELVPESDGLVEKATETWLEMIAIPKSTSPSTPGAGATYRRGWTYALEPTMRFEAVPFKRRNGEDAVGVVLRGTERDYFAGWFRASRADEATAAIAHLNAEITAELQRHSSGDETITLEIGSEFAPDSPFGRETVRIDSAGGVTYEQRNRGAALTAKGRADDALWAAMKAALARTTFPRPPQESFLPGGSMMRLSTSGVSEGQVLLDYYDALEMDGYRELTSALAGICTLLRTREVGVANPWNVRAAT